MMMWYDFNTAEAQTSYDLIPYGTLAKVKLKIKPGGYSDETQGWVGGYATKSYKSGVVYLDCEFVVLEGEYAKRKVWSSIGLFSPNNENRWGAMGRSFIRAILNSKHGISDEDTSDDALHKRRLNSLAELDGTEFIARIDVKKEQDGKERNVIQNAVTVDHKEYAAIKGMASSGEVATTSTPKPSWA